VSISETRKMEQIFKRIEKSAISRESLNAFVAELSEQCGYRASSRMFSAFLKELADIGDLDAAFIFAELMVEVQKTRLEKIKRAHPTLVVV